ncbi:MAG: homocysteine S-methyltransferase family protein, partial [Bacteroidaceae bacterium]|nr:homocysteine S-methyltransferase family protein [Bacteroidaceae bacterium]
MRTYLQKTGHLLLDGGFGSMLLARRLSEQHYRAARFANLPRRQTGNNDLLCLSSPDIVADIHRAYLEAGADIISTNTFNAQRVSLADYGCQHLVREINLEAARLARRLADEYSVDGRQRFVAGSVGPTNKTLSISPDVEDPAARAITFDELADAYREQMEALIEGGVDALLIETVFDTLNAKAALYAAE